MSAPALPGQRVPAFRAPTLDGNPQFDFDTVSGRHIVLLFAGSAAHPASAAALRLVARDRTLFDDSRASFFGVTNDPADAAERRIARQLPGIRWFLDHDGKVAKLYGAADRAGQIRPFWLLLDPMLRVLARAPIEGGEAILRQLAAIVAEPKEEGIAPVLIVPRVFDPELCRRLIGLYDADGGRPSGFMREVEGVTVGMHDHGFKRRSDLHLDGHPQLQAEIRGVLARTLVPEIQRAFQFRVTRIERYLVACYDGDGDGGYFRAHRDNTTAGTAHRRFACSINLNAEDYDGGDLCFPEFGARCYRPPTGGAAVFSCSVMHEATPVTRGRRYAYLPFFYDEAAARQREEIAKTGKVAANLAGYRAGGQ